MANASFCPACGEVVSDGCPVLDDEGNETNENNYTPCQCETGIDSNGRRVKTPATTPTPPLVTARDHLRAAHVVLSDERDISVDVERVGELDAVIEQLDTTLLKLREVGHGLRWAE